MATPEGRELRKQWSTKPRKQAGRPKGVPDGFRREQIEPIRAQAKKEAEKVVKIMAEEFGVESKVFEQTFTYLLKFRVHYHPKVMRGTLLPCLL